MRSFPFSPWTHRSLLLPSHSPKGLGPNSHKLIKSYLPSTDPVSRYRHMGIRTSAFECEGHNSVHSMIMQVKQFPSSPGVLDQDHLDSVPSWPLAQHDCECELLKAEGEAAGRKGAAASWHSDSAGAGLGATQQLLCAGTSIHATEAF